MIGIPIVYQPLLLKNFIYRYLRKYTSGGITKLCPQT